MQAVVEGHLQRVRYFLRMGLDLDKTGTSDLTVLHRAVLAGHEDIVELLVQAGANVNATSDDFGTPLCLAALKGLAATIKLFIEHRARPIFTSAKLGTALHCCILSLGDHRDAVGALIDAGAPLSAHASLDTRWMQSLCHWDGDDRNAITPEEQFDGFTMHHVSPALLAIQSFQGGLLEMLLPPDLDAVSLIIRCRISDEISAPHSGTCIRKIYQGHAEGLRLPNFYTCLSSCAAAGDIRSARLLIAKGAKLDLEDEPDLITPLMLAAMRGSKEMTRLLLSSGVTVEKCDLQGSTAIDYAARAGQRKVVRMLSAHSP